MSRPAASPRRSPRPKRRKSLPVAAAVFSLGALVLAISLPEGRERRGAVAETLPADGIVALLPDGVDPSPFAPLELPDVPQSSYVVGYARADAPYAALIRWDRESGAYRRTAAVAIADESAPLHGQPTFSSLPLGTDAPVTVLVRASLGASTDGLLVLIPAGNALVPASLVGEDGAVGPARFVSGAGARHSDGVSFDDVDGDGDRDAVVRASTVGDDGTEAKTARVFAWREGRFAYDKELSAVLTVSASVFPEPEAAPAE